MILTKSQLLEDRRGHPHLCIIIDLLFVIAIVVIITVY